MTKIYLCLVLLVAVVGTAIAEEQILRGPCREWLQNDCSSGRWVCTSIKDFEQQRHWGLGCPLQNLEPPTRPPGQCTLLNGVCQYTQTTLECDVWVPDCDYRLMCGTVEERERTTNTDAQCGGFGTQPPPPDMLCIPINDTCQWYNPCHFWRGYCSSGYRCGTADQYYEFVFGPHPLCAQRWAEPIAPGECVVVENQQCGWSNCSAYLDWCQTSWSCGTQYDEAVYRTSHPPPCPAPPPDYRPPPQPGVCQFNATARQCNFQADSSKGLKAVAILGISVGVVAGACTLLVMMLCLVVVLTKLLSSRKADEVPTPYKDDLSKEQDVGKYSELKLQDSISESSLEKEDLSLLTTIKIQHGEQ